MNTKKRPQLKTCSGLALRPLNTNSGRKWSAWKSSAFPRLLESAVRKTANLAIDPLAVRAKLAGGANEPWDEDTETDEVQDEEFSDEVYDKISQENQAKEYAKMRTG